jgi:hypothetical protein
MRYAGLVARNFVKRIVCVFVSGKPEENYSLIELRHRWKENIKTI